MGVDYICLKILKAFKMVLPSVFKCDLYEVRIVIK